MMTLLADTAVRQAIAEEPELPDAMPDEMWEMIRSDRSVAENCFRIAVRQTKQGILDRLALVPSVSAEAIEAAAVRQAMERAERNVELHIEREIFHEGTARAVVEEFTEQLRPLLAAGKGEPS